MVGPDGHELAAMSFHDNMGDPTTTPGSEDGVEMDTVVADNCVDEGLFTGEDTYLQRTRDGPRDGGSFKKKRSKSADMWKRIPWSFPCWI